MTDLAIQKRREYQKIWRDNNKEKTRIYNKRYWEKRAKLEELQKVFNNDLVVKGE